MQQEPRPHCVTGGPASGGPGVVVREQATTVGPRQTTKKNDRNKGGMRFETILNVARRGICRILVKIPQGSSV